MGWDDYITMSFQPKELLLSINALLKRSGALESKEKYFYKGIAINAQSKSVALDNKTVFLTNLEFDILLYFMKNKSKVIDKTQKKDRQR